MLSISIVTACLNAGRVIKTCLESVANQSVDVEHIIVDGQSTDDTLEVIGCASSPVRLVSERDAGVYHALNKGIAMAQGEVIGILHADDYYPEVDILSNVAELLGAGNLDSCYGDLQYIDADDSDRVVRDWRAGRFEPEKFLWGWMPPHPTFFVRSSVYQKFGAFRTDLGTSADYELMIRFLYKHRITTAYIPRLLVKMRTGGLSNATWRRRWRANLMDREAWRVNDVTPYPWTTLVKPLRKLGQWL